MSDVNWAGVKEALLGEVEETLRDLVEGAEEDIKEYGQKISVLMLVSLQSNNPDMRDELIAQTKTLAEIYRIRAVNAQWDVVGKTFSTIFSVAFRILSAI